VRVRTGQLGCLTGLSLPKTGWLRNGSDAAATMPATPTGRVEVT